MEASSEVIPEGISSNYQESIQQLDVRPHSNDDGAIIVGDESRLSNPLESSNMRDTTETMKVKFEQGEVNFSSSASDAEMDSDETTLSKTTEAFDTEMDSHEKMFSKTVDALDTEMYSGEKTLSKPIEALDTELHSGEKTLSKTTEYPDTGVNSIETTMSKTTEVPHIETGSSENKLSKTADDPDTEIDFSGEKTLSETKEKPAQSVNEEIKHEKEECENSSASSDVNLAEQINQNSRIHNKKAEKSFKCFHCDKTFRFKSLLSKHMLSHSKERPFPCTMCEKTYKRKDDLTQHQKTHERDRPRKSKKRKSHLDSSETESLSISSDKIKEEFHDNYQENFNQEEEVKEDVQIDDSSCTSQDYEKRYQCPSCHMSFSFYSLLRNHMVSHSKERPFECRACPKSFKRKYDLIKHIKIHPELEDSYKDNLSNEEEKGNEDDSEANANHISHLVELAEQTEPDYSLCSGGVDDRPFKCPVCELTFRLKGTLVNHVVIHSDDRPYKCLICKKGFKRKDNLIQHGKTHEKKKRKQSNPKKNSSKSGKSNTISKLVSSRSKASIIPGRVYRVRKVPKETVCDAPMKDDVGDRPYQCPFCNFAFRLKTHLTRHLLIHTGKRPYPCSICHKGFKRKDDMLKHEKIHIAKNKPGDMNEDDQGDDAAETSSGQDHSILKSKTVVKGKRKQKSLHSSPKKGREHAKGKVGGSKRNNLGANQKLLRSSKDKKSLMNNSNVKEQKDVDNEEFDVKDTEMITEQATEYMERVKKETEKGDEQTVEYADCNVIFSQDIKEGIHKLPKSQSKWHVCLICKKSYIREADLKMHHKKVHESNGNDNVQRDERPYKCTICLMAFRMKGNLKIHMLKHSDEKPFACNVCKKAFKRKYDLDKHKGIHSKNKRHICNSCGRSFKSRLWLAKHMKYHESENSLQCSICKKVCQNRGQFIAHVKGHKKSQSSICPLCGKSFTAGTNLKQHLRRHKGEKPFKCTICPRSFVSKGEMLRHVNSHTREKSYMCDICGNEFTLLSSLRTHARIHSGEKPFKCYLCPKTFNQSHHLKTHLRSHLGDKPYKCTACDKAFSDRRTLKNHMVRHPNHPMPAMSTNEKVKRELGPQLEMQSLQALAKKLGMNNAGRDQDGIENIGNNGDGSQIVNFRHFSEMSHAVAASTNPYNISQDYEHEDTDMISDDIEMDEIMRISEGWEGNKTDRSNTHGSVERNSQEPQMSHGEPQMSHAEPPMSHGDPATYSGGQVMFGHNANQVIQPTNSNHPMIQLQPTSINHPVVQLQPTSINHPVMQLQPTSSNHPVMQPQPLPSQTHLPAFSGHERVNTETQKDIDQRLWVDYSHAHNRAVEDMQQEELNKVNDHSSWIESNANNSAVQNPQEPNKDIDDKRWFDTNDKSVDDPNLKETRSDPGNNTDPESSDISVEVSPSQREEPVKNKDHPGLDDTCDEKAEKDEKACICTLCDMKFSTCEALKKHILTHATESGLSSDSEEYSCNICDKTFSSKDKWQKHKERHARKSKTKHNCSLCGKEFKGKRWLDNHMKFHENENSLQCSICKETCDSKGDFMEHIKTHKKVASKVCPVCGKEFTSGNNLKQHLRRHKGEKPFECTICPRSFVSKGEMLRHVNSHTREKSYMCDICGNEFTLLSSLRTHARIHTGEKPFKCSMCPKSFNQGHHLKTHVRSHLGDKPYKCDLCEKSFSDRRTLKNHLLRHAGSSSTNSVTVNVSLHNNNPVPVPVPAQTEARILHTPHGDLMNLNYSHMYCDNY